MTRRINVLNYHPLFLPFPGGVEQNIYSFAKYSRHKHIVFTDLLENTSNFEEKDGIFIYRVSPTREPTVSLKPFEMILDLIREINKAMSLNKISFDIMNLRASYVSIRLFYFMDKLLRTSKFKNLATWRLCKKPIVVTFHNLPSHGFPSIRTFLSTPTLTTQERNSWMDIEKYLCTRAECVICVDQYMLKPLKKLSRGKTIIYVPSAVDVEKYRPISRKNALKRLHPKIRERINEQTFNILYVGRIELTKGAHLLCDLAQHLPDSSRLIVAGHGNLMILQRSERINYVGIVENEELPYLINACDAVFNPTLVNGTGRVTFEAMACGKPAIMLEGDRYPLIDGRNGFVARSLDDIIAIVYKLQNDSSLFETISKNGIRTAKEYSIQNMAEKMDKIYEFVYERSSNS